MKSNYFWTSYEKRIPLIIWSFYCFGACKLRIEWAASFHSFLIKNFFYQIWSRVSVAVVHWKSHSITCCLILGGIFLLLSFLQTFLTIFITLSSFYMVYLSQFIHIEKKIKSFAPYQFTIEFTENFFINFKLMC